MDSCNRLTEIANAARVELLNKNIYFEKQGFIYGPEHPNATQAQGRNDDPYNKKGKGTGIKFDTNNGGSNVDIFGLPELGGGGRNEIFKNQYNPSKKYDCFI